MATVTLGPDLNGSRPDTDLKQYRLVTLPNGLECLLISDTRARQEEEDDDDEGEEEEDFDSEEDGAGSDCSGRGKGGKPDLVQSDPVHENGNADSDGGAATDMDADSEAASNAEAGRKRRAAVCMVVGTGSFTDPLDCLGLAHFLEHMLFMGSEKYPEENAFDAFLAKHGGDSNAYTEGEHTSYYFNVKVDALEEALDMFAQFFVAPLMLEDAVDRELNAIQNEFQLSRSSEASRLQEIVCASTRENHPMGKFGWGNLRTLRDEPAKNGVEPLKRLRAFYEEHYVASNMKLSICAPTSLDELERMVIEICKVIRSNPEYTPLSLATEGMPFQGETAALAAAGPEAPGSLILQERVALTCAFFMVPITDHHSVTLSWQIPPQLQHYRSKPFDYVCHLLGHESAGSLFEIAKTRGWATSLYAGGSSCDLETNTGCTVLHLKITLTRRGVCEWKEVVHLVVEHIALLRALGPQEWVHEELADSARLDFRFLEDGDPEDTVQEFSMNMLPQRGMAREDLLTGPHLFEEWCPDLITEIFDCLTVANMRVDLVSSFFGLDRDYKSAGERDQGDENDFDGEAGGADGEHDSGDEGDHDHDDDEEEEEGQDVSENEDDEENGDEGGHPTGVNADDDAESLEFPNNPKDSGEEPMAETYFGTRFWARRIDEETLAQWQATAEETFADVSSQAEDSRRRSKSGLRLPPRNLYIARDISLKPFPPDNALHPLVGAFVRVQLKQGKRFRPAMAFVQRFNENTGAFELAVEDDLDGDFRVFYPIPSMREVEDWEIGRRKFPLLLSDRKTEASCEVIAGNNGNSSPQHLHEAAEYLFEQRDAQPDNRIAISANRMPELSPAFSPQLAKCSTEQFKLWCLHDRVFLHPKTSIVLNLIWGPTNTSISSPKHAAASDLFIILVAGALTDEAYLASMAELEYGLQKSDAGFRLRFSGFSEKLFSLVDIVLAAIFTFGQPGSKYTTSPAQYEVQRETLARSYRNAGIKSPRLATNLRLRALRPTQYSSRELLDVITSDCFDTLEKLMDFCRAEIFTACIVDGLLCGNVTHRQDAPALHKLVTQHLRAAKFAEFPRSLRAAQGKVIYMQPGELLLLEARGRDPKDHNSSLELYIQIGQDSLSKRLRLDLIEQLMEEPIYDQLRTKRQLGYSVSCGLRLTNKVLGYVVRVTSSTHKPQQLHDHAIQFLTEFETTMKEMSDDDIEDAIRTLVEVKLEEDNNLNEEVRRHWSAIADQSLAWQESRREAFSLFSLTREDILEAYREWLLPTSPSCRMLSVQVTGEGADGCGDGPDVVVETPHTVIRVEDTNEFHRSRRHFPLEASS